MSGSSVLSPALPLDAAHAKPVLPLSPSFTAWEISPVVQPRSCRSEAASGTRQHRSHSLIRHPQTIDLTLDDESERDPAIVNQHSSPPTQSEVSDIIEDTQSSSPTPSRGLDLVEESRLALTDPQPPSQAASTSETNVIEQSTCFDLTEDFDSTCDNMIVPEKHRKQLGEPSQSPVIDVTTDYLYKISEHTVTRNRSPGSVKSVRPEGRVTNISFCPAEDLNQTDVDEPMPRLLPKFAKSSLDLNDEDGSNTEDDNEDVITKEELRIWLHSQTGRDSALDIYGISPTPSTHRICTPQPRNLPVEHPFSILETYTHNDIVLRPGVSIELRDAAFVEEGDRKGVRNRSRNSFMRIADVIQDTRSHAVTLRGRVFQRAQYLNGILEKKRNELCWVMHVDEDDNRDIKVQSMETVPVEDVVRRRKIRLTNQPFPRLSFREDPHVLEDSEETIRNERVLVCRFIYICCYVCAERREANCWSERSLRRLRHADCDRWSGSEGEPCALDDAELRKVWRGETIPGGAFLSKPQEETWRERLEDIVRKNAVDLTGEMLKQDLDVTALSSTPRDHGQPFQVTGIATRVDWITADGTEHYTINGRIPSKRTAAEDLFSEVPKRHRKQQLTLKVERPPQTVSLLSQLRRKSSVVEVAPWESTPRPSEPQMLDVKPRGVSNSPSPKGKRQYTFGDSFCGAGGMSRAAHQTGLHIKYAFDCNKNACNTYAMNFPKADLHCLWAHEFVQLNTDCKVDIAHLSPPCQFFSDAHTVAGKDDEMNTASLFAVGEILKKSKPRVVTLEQTFGIVLRARHQGYLNALVQVFTSHGFSIRWRLLHCADYGLPQMRLRTFMIASWYVFHLTTHPSSLLPNPTSTCPNYLKQSPGEPLPPFPPPTHTSSPAPGPSSSTSTSLLPYTTITSTLSQIPPTAPNHSPHLSRPRALPAYNGHKIARTITCNGGGMVHPSGTRDFTVREFAALQGFPVEHVFGNVGGKKQVGNAVPPVVGRRVLEGVVRGLEVEDGLRKEE
ncbi:MAG: hypothetical protein LQ338_007548 [Usnochroma carphineum]|nr:MAG: hypothetical protein LQ338_007548 [Usnochroma carphineum]